MHRTINPAEVHKPGSRYAHGIVHAANAERLVISGQVGMATDGSIAEGFAEQARIAWANFMAVVEGAGFRNTDIVRVCIYLVAPKASEPYTGFGDQLATYRAARDEALGGHLCAATLLVVSGLAHPAYLIEIDGEAVRAGA